MEKYKIQTISHYWRLKQDQEILKREVVKRAKEYGEADHDWARMKGKLAKLNMILAPFEDSYREIKIEEE